MPIFGKLSDMYGRKIFFIAGLIVFMIGSALCGTAASMEQLIIYRAIQGIGGGALMPIVFTIIFDIFPAEKRGKMQGLFGAVFGISSVLGPLAGAFFTDYADWRWCFYINLPLGIIALFMIMAAYHESKSHSKQKIDWLGTVLMIGAILCLLFGLELGGKQYAWDSWQIVSLFAGFVVLLALFLFTEKKVTDPIISLGLFRNRLFSSSMGVGFFYGAIMISGATYIPLFIQGVFGGSATSAGLVLTPMMLGVVASSAIGGRFTNGQREAGDSGQKPSAARKAYRYGRALEEIN
jgi:EmrB/QacA subfamily drug resistance transporter